MPPTNLNTLTRRALFSKGALAVGSAIALPGATLLLESSGEAAQSQPSGKVPLRIIVVDSLAEAQLILARLKTGEDFARLAMEKSIDPTANQGGYLGQLDPQGLRPELRDALQGVRPNQVSPVVKIPEGYAILKIEQQDPAEAEGDNPNRLLALSSPGAVSFGPDVDGLNEELAAFYNVPKPDGWDRSVVTIADIHQQSVASAIKQLREVLDPANPEKLETGKIMRVYYLLAELYAFEGDMGTAIEQWKSSYRIAQSSDPKMLHHLEEVLGIAYLHKSEMENEVYLAPGERCLFPMSPHLCYSKTEDSKQAAQHFLKFLEQQRDDLEARWLLNLTSMTLGEYPANVPAEYRIPLTAFKSKQDIGRFVDVAPEVGLKFASLAGGIIVDDFENRGRFDVFVSEMGHQFPRQPLRYFHNNGDGTFSEQTEKAGLAGLPGGLNINQADYNNDGSLDVLVMRGGWEYPQPLTLLRGNGDGTFTEVTREAGLTPLIATQCAAWADINNDGLLDLFVGNEGGPSRLFLNKGNGTFEDISASSGVDRLAFTKGVVAGDYDNDGYMDFYVTNIGSNNFLYHNEHNNTFREVARDAGVRDPLGRSFATWFFDYDNDGWLDLFATSSYAGSVDENLRTYLGLSHNAITLKLFKNLSDGTFRDVTKEVSLDKVFMPMGANFGDVDNDGFLDIYLGTGSPSYGSLVPNVLLRNHEGREFVDITASSGTGELHKGHGIAFADMNNTGHQDILTVIGGAVPGDQHAFRFFRNPGNGNDWIRTKLVGVKSNRAAVGARIKVTVENEGCGTRSIHRTVGSGGSFGASPFEQHIGLGPAARIQTIEVWWPASDTRQVFSAVRTNQVIEIKEFAKQFTILDRRTIPFGGKHPSAPG
jgi:tetratricopeptide (TPR) repeat protein